MSFENLKISEKNTNSTILKYAEKIQNLENLTKNNSKFKNLIENFNTKNIKSSNF